MKNCQPFYPPSGKNEVCCAIKSSQGDCLYSQYVTKVNDTYFTVFYSQDPSEPNNYNLDFYSQSGDRRETSLIGTVVIACNGDGSIGLVTSYNSNGTVK